MMLRGSSEMIEVDQMRVKATRCARDWEQLTQRAITNVRHCDGCAQHVFQVTTAQGMRVALSERQCVHVPEERTGHTMLLGNVEPAPYEVETRKLNWD